MCSSSTRRSATARRCRSRTRSRRTPDAPEADGYLIVPICRFMENRSGFLIFDTPDIGQGPITRIDVPFQIGWTPHGHWMDRR